MMISTYPILSALLNIATYDPSKMFQPIVLFNILGKLIKKVIGKRLQTSIHYIKSYLFQSARWIEAELDY